MKGPGRTRLPLVVWGTYDVGKPRVRLLLAGARQVGLELFECHADVWRGVADKSQLRGPRTSLAALGRWLLAYPSLVWRYLRLPRHGVVLVPYLGQLDVLVIWPWARLRRARIVWDAFVSLYDTVVDDRRLVSRRSPVAFALWLWEWLACRAADHVFLDTEAQARFFERRFRLPPGSVARVVVGAEDLFFAARGETPASGRPPTVLFYGQFIPLHGIDTILDAARLLTVRRPGVRWRIVGRGQESARLDAALRERPVAGVERVEWEPYERLPRSIADAAVCLGIFGTSAKAARVVPNKVYQILAAGRPLVTADTPAARELLVPGPELLLVPPGDASALAAAVEELLDLPADREVPAPGPEATVAFDAEAVGRQLLACLDLESAA